jgi:hypothetical protein
MLLSEVREIRDERSTKASEVARALALAGIAITWIFRESGGAPRLPPSLLPPLTFFALALAFDLLHYVLSALAFAYLQWREDRRRVATRDDYEVHVPAVANWPGNLCYAAKLLSVGAGYILLVRYLWQLWLKA